VLNFIPRGVLPFVPMIGLMLMLIAVVLLGSQAFVMIVLLLIWVIPLSIAVYRHRRGLETSDDGMPVGRLVDWVRKK
jgi:hypothetical protein